MYLFEAAFIYWSLLIGPCISLECAAGEDFHHKQLSGTEKAKRSTFKTLGQCKMNKYSLPEEHNGYDPMCVLNSELTQQMFQTVLQVWCKPVFFVLERATDCKLLNLAHLYVQLGECQTVSEAILHLEP